MDKDDNLPQGLRTSGLLAEKPIIGIMMFIFGGLIFAILAYNVVTNGPLLQWDWPLAQSMHTFALNSSPLMTTIMIDGYYIGLEGLVIVAIILGLYFIYKRFWQEAVMVVVSLGGGGLLFQLLSGIFVRPRPFLLFESQIWAGSPNIPGFPSGHVLNLMGLCGFLIYLFWPKVKSHFGKFLMILFALILLAYVGFSRLYVGDHYITDIIAGYAVGIAWFGLVFTSIELLFKKYNQRKN